MSCFTSRFIRTLLYVAPVNADPAKSIRWQRAMIMLLVFGLIAGSLQPVAGRQPGPVVTAPQSAEASQLMEQVGKLRDQGKYTEAIPLLERLLVLAEKEAGPEDPAVAHVLSGLGELYRLTGDFARAEPVYRRALTLREKLLGREHPDVAIALNNFALLYSQKGDYATAEPMFQRALAIYERTPGANPQALASPLSNLGQLYQAKGDYVKAEPLLVRTLAIIEKQLGPDHPAVALAVNNLAGLYENKGDYARTETLYRRSLSIREKALGPEHPDVAQSLNNLASLYKLKGDFLAAEPLYQRSIAVTEKTLGREHYELANPLINLALLYTDKGDNTRAEALLLRALAIREKTFGSEHPAVAHVLNNLADLYERKGEFARVEPLYQRALAIVEKAFGPEHPIVATVLTNLARTYQMKGDIGRAEAMFQRSLAIREKVLGPEHPDLGVSLNNLGLFYMSQGEFGRAEPILQRALTIIEKTFGPDHPHMAMLAHNLAAVFDNKNDLGRAVTFQTRSNEIEERNLALILTTGSQEQKSLYLDTLSLKTHFTVSLNARRAGSSTEATRLALTTILRRKGRALDAATDQIGALRRRLNPQDRVLLEQLSAAQAQLATLALTGPGGMSPAMHQEAVARARSEVERLEAAVSARSSEFRAQTQPVTLERVQEALPAGTTLIEFVLYRPFAQGKAAETIGPPRYVAYVLARQGAPTWVDLGEAAPIDKAVTDFRKALSSPQSTDVKVVARTLDEQLMSPVRKLIGETRTVFLSPDGALNLIPFGALVDEKNQYLVENYSITYLTSGRDLLRLQARSESRQMPVVIANPQFDQAATNQPAITSDAGGRRSVDFGRLKFGLLKGTADEAQALGTILTNARVLTDAQATEAALKQVAGPSILHVATHGFFLPDQPQEAIAETRGLGLTDNLNPTVRRESPFIRSGLALAGANSRQGGNGEDGILTALEAAGLDLWGTKLVVLSACETGVGEVKNGEGVYGLRRALVLAGAESQVISLWQVSDAATRDLMVAYYKRLQAGEGRTAALSAVQLEMLKSNDQTGAGQNRGIALETSGTRKDRSHPFFWASFIQSGEWRSLSDKR